MGLIHSFDLDPNSISDVHTRAVARVHIRIGITLYTYADALSNMIFHSAQWRQQHFRPNKPLLTDTGESYDHHPSHPAIQHFCLDIISSLLCLGIPNFLVNWSQRHRIDEESRVRNPPPMVMVNVCVCIVVSYIRVALEHALLTSRCHSLRLF